MSSGLSIVQYAAIDDQEQQIRGIGHEACGDGCEQPVSIGLLLQSVQSTAESARLARIAEYPRLHQKHTDDREYHGAGQMPDLSAAYDERAGTRTGVLEVELRHEVCSHRRIDLVNRQDHNRNPHPCYEPRAERLREQQCCPALRLLLVARLC